MSEKPKIYVVQGSTGEYSDHCEWLVAAFYSEQKAADLVVAATRRANELYAQHKDNTWGIPDGANEHDPMMETDYTGTRYCHFGIEIHDKPQPATPEI
jgi:hypothetical protein